MTERKDFKRIVRARARRTGESYSSALRNVRNARHTTGSHEEDRPIAITRTIPDIRSTKIANTTRFYTELLGFDTRITDGHVVAFVSPTDATVEVTLNRDGFTLPPGFTVEVESVEAVAALYERRNEERVRTIEELKPDGSQFSVLDPSGRRVTVAASADWAPSVAGDSSRSISRAIPGVTTNDPGRHAAVLRRVPGPRARRGRRRDHDVPVARCDRAAGDRQHTAGESGRVRPRRRQSRPPRPDPQRRPKPIDRAARARRLSPAGHPLLHAAGPERHRRERRCHPRVQQDVDNPVARGGAHERAGKDLRPARRGLRGAHRRRPARALVEPIALPGVARTATLCPT